MSFEDLVPAAFTDAWKDGGTPEAWMDLVPALDVAAWAQDSLRQPAFATLSAGGLCFSLCLVLRFAVLLMQVHRGHTVSWGAPILHVALVLLLLRHYEGLVTFFVRFAAAFGSAPDGADRLQEAAGLRADALSEHVLGGKAVDQMGFSFAQGQIFLLSAAATLLQVACKTAMVVVSSLQVLLLAALVQVGPFVLAASLLPGASGGWLLGWTFALLEVSSWSWLHNLIARLFGEAFLQASQKPFSYPHDIAQSAVLLALVSAVPWVAAQLFRAAGRASRALVPSPSFSPASTRSS